jgi:hypothetical protein
MHRLINNTPDGLETDHINRNRLDNRRKNLKSVTYQENQFNRDYQHGLFIGGKYSDGTIKYGAAIGLNGKSIFLGYFRNIPDAIGARVTAEECMI